MADARRHSDAFHVLSTLIGADPAPPRAVASQASRVLDPSRVQQIATDLRERGAPAVVLATCHRLEVCWWGHAQQAPVVMDVVGAAVGVPPDRWRAPQHGDDALQHLIAVASGLRSPRRGEPEILGQVRAAWQAAQAVRATTPELDRHLQGAIAAARYVRRTLSRTEAETIGDATVALIQRMRAADAALPAPTRLLIVGAGEVGQSVADAVASARRVGVLPATLTLRIANRTAAGAEQLASRVGGTPVNWSQWPTLLAAQDMVVFAVRTARPLVTQLQADAVADARQAPALWVDLASPPNVEGGGHGVLRHCALADLASTDGEESWSAERAEQVLAREVVLFREAQQRRQAWSGDAAARVALHAH